MTYEPCDAFITLIVRAADDTLTAEEARRLDAHMADCPGCRDALADQRIVHLQLEHLQLAATGEEFASPGFEKAVMDAVRADSPWTEILNWRAWTWRLVPVAGLFVLVAVGVARTSQTASSTSSTSSTVTTETTMDLSVASAMWSTSVSDESLLALVLTAKADDPLSAHIKKDQ